MELVELVTSQLSERGIVATILFVLVLKNQRCASAIKINDVGFDLFVGNQASGKAGAHILHPPPGR
jgi:hypothetical protein